MLDSAMKDQLSGIFSGLVSQYVFDIQVAPDHESRQELIDLLGDVASCSDHLSCSVADGEGLQFTIVKDGMPTGIRFRAVPNGHEFTSLLLAVLNCDGKGKKYTGRKYLCSCQSLEWSDQADDLCFSYLHQLSGCSAGTQCHGYSQ